MSGGESDSDSSDYSYSTLEVVIKSVPGVVPEGLPEAVHMITHPNPGCKKLN